MVRGLAIFLALMLAVSICEASIVYPVSESHRSAAAKLFEPTDGAPVSLEETYEALRTHEILGIERKPDIKTLTCPIISTKLSSSSSSAKDLFYALRVNGILKCEVKDDFFEGINSRLQAFANAANSLFDFYYSIGSLVLVKDQTSNVAQLEDANGIFRSIKALSQSDGRWRYGSDNLESSSYAAGIALETLAGVVSVASSELDQSLIESIEQNIIRLFDSIEKYDDGTFYFDDARGNKGALSTTASVVRGITVFSDVASGSLSLPGDKILGLAKFFLGMGIPGNAKDLFYQIDSLACLESNRVSIPLILSLPATVLSLSMKDQLKVNVCTVLGSSAPPLTVKLLKAFSSDSKARSITESQELMFDAENMFFYLDTLPKSVDVGKYIFVFEAVLEDPEHARFYFTGGEIHVLIFVTGLIKTESAEISVLDSDLGSIETLKKLDLTRQNTVSLSANHLQKLRLTFQLITPLGNIFEPHQALLKLKHESKVEHIFLVGGSEKKLEIVLDFLGLVEKLFYLSGTYDIGLTVGDSVMENSFQWGLGQVELDLPEAPEKAARPPPVPIDPYLRYGGKAEINHIFKSPEKRPPKELSVSFLGLTLLPLIGLLIGLFRLGVDVKNFPTSAVPATFGILFQLGIAAVLMVFILFWIKWDLFRTLKAVGLLGVFLVVVGHGILSHLASASAKLKSA